MSSNEWANRFMFLPTENSPIPGLMSTGVTPYTQAILEACDDPATRKVVVMKSSQIGYTIGVLLPVLFKRIDLEPSPMVIMFPKEGQGKEFEAEKLTPIINASPRLRTLIDTSPRKTGNTKLFKKFPGGFLKMVGSNSPASVKSTSAPLLAVEEPDDANLNVGGQGNSIALLQDRAKNFRGYKILIGGTPKIKNLSTIEFEYLASDQRELHVPCHDCGDAHALDWSNVVWLNDAQEEHELYGRANLDSAAYACPHCGSLWSDWQKNQNVAHACHANHWIARKPFRGVAGFRINELYSPFPGSTFTKLLERRLKADHKAERGELDELIAFVGSVEGRPYEYVSDAPQEDELRDRAEDFPLRQITIAGQDLVVCVVPNQGLILTAGVDLQHDRIAILIEAWGKGEESWRILCCEIYGNVIDKSDPVWETLRQILIAPYLHASGAELFVRATSIDCSDGQTVDAAYTFVRNHGRAHQFMAIKGSSAEQLDTEIFRTPRESIDSNRRNTRAARYGLRVFIAGTHKAKSKIDGQLRLEGSGPGRRHVFRGIREDYFEQMLSEVYAPHPRNPRKKIWQLKSGRRNEFLDCSVYSLHAAYSLKVHLMKDYQWDALQQQLLQTDLFSAAPSSADREVKSMSAPGLLSSPAQMPQSVSMSVPLSPKPVKTIPMFLD